MSYNSAIGVTGRSNELSLTGDKLRCYDTVFDMSGGLTITNIHVVPLLGLEHTVNFRLFKIRHDNELSLPSEHLLS